MTDTIATWRAAMADEQHPRHTAAWLLFAPNTSVKGAARLLQDGSLDVIPWLYEILDKEELYAANSLGKGRAPIVAVGLLGQWQVTEAVPRLLSIIERYTWEDDIFDETISALQAMGTDVLDTVLTFAEEAQPDKQVDMSAVVCRIGQGDDRAFQFVQRVFENERDDVLQSFVVGNLYELDMTRAANYLTGYLRNNKVGPEARKAIQEPRPLRR